MNLLKKLFGHRDNNPKPYIDLNYACEGCGATDGKCHPDTGMCWHCGKDDFLPMEAFKLGKDFFQALVVKSSGTKPEYLFTKEGERAEFEDQACWIVVNGMVYHREHGYLAYSSPK